MAIETPTTPSLGLTPELSKSVLDNIVKRLKREEEVRRGGIRARAKSRNISGSTFEANRLASSERQTTDAITNAAVDLALQDALRAREDRIITEGREFTAGESEKGREFAAKQDALNREFASLENAKQLAFQRGENDLARQFQERQNAIQREFESSQAEQAGRTDLLNTSLGIGGNLLGLGVASKLFGRGGGVVGIPGATSPGGQIGPVLPSGEFVSPGGFGRSVAGVAPLLGKGLGIGGGLALSAAAGSGAGQLLGKNLFSGGARTSARKGAQLGGVLGTAFGPAGSFAGGTLGALTGGLTRKNPLKKVEKGAKKIFCFDGLTSIDMGDGSFKDIKDIALGDNTKGGVVRSIRVSHVDDGDRYEYGHVIVTGYHAVKEKDGWVRIKDSPLSQPLPGPGIVYSIVTDDHRIYVGETVFADEHETDNHENLNLIQSLAELNRKEAVNG
jgi:hypothetical protein